MSGTSAYREFTGKSVEEALRLEGVTHVVWPADKELAGAGLEEIKEVAGYRVYQLTPRKK